MEIDRTEQVQATLTPAQASQLEAFLASGGSRDDLDAEIRRLLEAGGTQPLAAPETQRRETCEECKCGTKAVTCVTEVLTSNGWTPIAAYRKECGLSDRFWGCLRAGYEFFGIRLRRPRR